MKLKTKTLIKRTLENKPNKNYKEIGILMYLINKQELYNANRKAMIRAMQNKVGSCKFHIDGRELKTTRSYLNK